MSIVTVVGASGMTVKVTVDGGAAESLASSYSATIQNAHTGSSLTTYELTAGSNSPTTSGGLNQGSVTVGGAFTLNGMFDAAVVGGYDANGTMTQPVVLDARADGASSLSVLAGSTGGTSFFAGNQSGMFVGATGNNLYNAGGTSGNWQVATAAGNDTIIGSNGNNSITTGAGNNLVFLGSGNNSVVSNGHDTVDGSNGIDTVTLAGGSSVVSLHDKAAVVDTSTGNQVSVGSNSTVFGGNNAVNTFTGTSGTVVGGTGDTISAAGNLQVVHGMGNNISVGGALTFLNGTGNTTIAAGNATIFGASGLNLNLNSTSGYSLFVGDAANETVNGASSTHAFQAFSGTGAMTMIGGSGYDTLVGGVGGDTFTGGSGGALFALTQGHAGGNYQITDFGSAAGNLVALYQYGLQNNNGLQNVLSAATVTGGNSTIELADHSKITFVGVQDLKASDFTLS